MVFYNISHNIFGIISRKYFLLCFLIYCIVFHTVSRYVYYSISLKYFVLFFLIYFTIFVNIASNIPYAGQLLPHCFLRARLRGASWHCWQHCWPCQLRPVPRLAPHWSERTACQCYRRWCGGFRLGVEYLTTALIRLYFADTSREKRYYALLALFSWFALGRRRWFQTDD